MATAILARPVFVSDYLALSKPEVNFLIALTTAAAFRLGAPAAAPFPWLPMLHTVLGTLLVASGAGALNQWVERDHDARMRRTLRRPIAAGRMDAGRAFRFGAVLSCAGLLYLAIAVTAAASLLAALTIGWYLFLYTPLKRVAPVYTLVGAFCGAMPTLIGYAAAAGRLDRTAWQLYGILFLWQFPHFMSIAWMYRGDYDRAGYRILPMSGLRDSLVAWQTILPLAGLLLLAPSAFPFTFGFLYYGVRFSIRRSGSEARRLLFVSILYLPVLFVWTILFRL